MIDRPTSGDRAIVVSVDIARSLDDEARSEFDELCRSAGADVLETIAAARPRAEPRFLIGSGKADEIRDAVATSGADIVIVNHELSPSQERNLEQRCQCRVIDRIGLVLDIFAQRAQTFEGKLQVELAQLRHLSTRLVRGWSHLERQKGGIGLRGPGEKQLETDRRLLNVRIRQISKRLDQVQKRREVNRRARERADLPVVALVGYTNAGKSSLFNALTESAVLVEDKLFATLDPTLRRLDRPGQGAILMVDTVGFIRDLPHELVAAFRATLEETRQATLLLHVVDALSDARLERIEQVNAVLTEIGADEIPQVEVMNKIDLRAGVMPSVERPESLDSNLPQPPRVWVSATRRLGLSMLLDLIDELVRSVAEPRRVRLPAAYGRLRARLFSAGEVLTEATADNGDMIMEMRINPDLLDRLCRSEGLSSSGVTIH